MWCYWFIGTSSQGANPGYLYLRQYGKLQSMLKIMTKYLVLIVMILLTGCVFAKSSKLEGVYYKVENTDTIYLKIKRINDSIYFFLLRDYNRRNAHFKQRQVVGTFKQSGNNLFEVINGSHYPNHFSFSKPTENVIEIDTSNFQMYYSFKDITGVYNKKSDSININFDEFALNKVANNIYKARKDILIAFYDFPNIYSTNKKDAIKKDETVYAVIDINYVGKGNIVSSPEAVRFTLIEIPKLKIRKWVLTDNLEDYFK